jgi:hypothetical protein
MESKFMDASSNARSISMSAQTNGSNLYLDVDQLISDLVAASKSEDITQFKEKLTQAVRAEPGMFTLSGQSCLANHIFKLTEADSHPRIRTIWENALVEHTNINGNADDIRKALDSPHYRAFRLRPAVSTRPSRETQKPFTGEQQRNEAIPGATTTASVPTYHSPYSHSITTSATTEERANRSLAHFDLLSAEARKAFLNGDTKTYKNILAQLQAITPIKRSDANECSIQ